MTTTSESSRRAFLAALAASGAAAAALPGVADARGGNRLGVGADAVLADRAPEVFHVESFPTPTPGTSYMFILGGEFHPLLDTTVYSKSLGEVQMAGVFYFTLSQLPPGARITEVTFAVVKSAFYSGNATLFAYRMTSGAITTLDFKNTNALPQQAAEQYVSLTVNSDAAWVVDNEQAATHWLVANLATSRLNSVRVGYIDPTPRPFHPIAPKRVYDSRLIAPLGSLASGNNRVISVANGYATDTTTVDVPDVVPAGATAVAYNITIVNTAGSGYLSVNPGDAATLGGSSINWFQSGQTLANGLVVKLDGNRQVKVFCGGGGSTDFVVDVLGYYR